MSEKNSKEIIVARFSQVYPALKKMGTVSRLEFFLKVMGLNQRSSYYKIVRNERALSLQHIIALIEVYKISPTWLFLGEGEMIKGE